ncbi:MAG: PP2C family protein-serine/threonine phosphatase [Planctomycetota bacterium]|jgi:serine phosphatase RsbU (regulator of sigma subunit)
MAKKTKRQVERDEQIYQLTTDKLAEAAVKITNVKACSIRLLDDESDDLKMRSTYGLSEEYRNKGVVSKGDPVVKAAFAGEAVVLDDMRVDGRVKYKEATITEGLVSQLTVAMQFRSKAIGVLRLYSPKPKHFDEDDIGLARAVASQCAVAITNARLYAEAIEGSRIAEQMRLAGVIQRRMIPGKPPQVPGLDIAATYIPCFDVGGDFYDFFQIRKGRLGIVLGDVMGKGIPAALMMSCFKGAVSAFVDTLSSLGSIVQDYVETRGREAAIRTFIHRLNRMACSECKGSEFITLFYAALDVKENTLTYCNCGHEPAILIRDSEITCLEKGGLVLGIDPEAEHEIETIELKDGDAFLFYTDGLIDAVDFEGELWGREKLVQTAIKFVACPAEQMVRNILAYRRRFVGLARQTDDTTIVMVKVDRTRAPEFAKQVNS